LNTAKLKTKRKRNNVHLSFRQHNRLGLTVSRSAVLPPVLPAKSTSFSSISEMSERCCLAAKVCIATALEQTVEPRWGQNLNKMVPVVDGEEDDDLFDLTEEEVEKCLAKCDELFGGVGIRHLLEDAANSLAVETSAAMIVCRLKEFVDIRLSLQFRRNPGGRFVSAGVKCHASSAAIERRSRHVDDGPAYKNLKNFCYDGIKAEMPNEDYVTDYEDEEKDDCSAEDEADDDSDEEEHFEPVAARIMDMMDGEEEKEEEESE
jgi:hypothetical protein